MTGLFAGVVSAMPVTLGQLFPDVGGYLVSPEFVSLVANLVTTFLLSLLSVLLGEAIQLT
jgi:hypothetical protein